MSGASPGWAPDPSGRAPLRFWDGTSWTTWLSDGGTAVWPDPSPIRTAAPDDARVRFVAEMLLPAAAARGLVAEQQVAGLVGLARELTAQVAPTAAGPVTWLPEEQPAPTAGGWAVGPVPDAVWATPGAEGAGGVPGGLATGTFPTAAPRPDGRRGAQAAAALGRVRSRFGSELAVHGLAYLGVALMFAGLFGLVAFAFGDVAPALRPLAELGSVLVPFVAATLLHRQGAVVVARAMEALGGLLVPLMVVTSLVDGAGFPPDAARSGTAPVVLAGACVLVAGAQVAWVRRRPGSGVRYAVAPTGWLAAAMATIAVGRPMPSGQAVASPVPAQIAAMAVAVAVTAVVARGRSGPLGRAAGAAVLPGTALVLALGAVTAAGHGWPLLPVVLTLLACAVAWDRSEPLLPARVRDGLAVAGVLLAALRVLIGPLDQRPVRVAAMVAVTALLVATADLMGRRARSTGARAAALVGLCLGATAAVLVLAGDRELVARWVWAGGVALAVTGWSLSARRTGPGHAEPGWSTGLGWLAGLAQGLLVLVGGMHSGPTALLVGVTLLALAGPAGRLPVLSRGPGDRFWTVWWVVLGAGVGVGALARTASAVAGPSTAGGQVLLTATFAGLLVAVLLGPLPTRWRTWASTTVGWWGWLTVAQVAGVPRVWWAAGLVLAVAGLALAAQTVRRSGPAVALAGAAHATALVALLTAHSWSVPVAWAALTAVWLLTAVGTDRGTGPWRLAGAPLGRAAGPVAWSVALLALPVAAATALHTGGLVGGADPWRGLAFVLVAAVYPATTRARRLTERSAAGAVLAPVGYGAAVLATVLALVEAGPGATGTGASGRSAAAALGLGVLAAVPLLARPGRRPAVAVWTAVVVLPAFGWTTVRAVGPDGWWATGWPLGAVVLLGAGGAALVGALMSESARPARRPWPPARPTLPALTVGSVHLALGTTVAVLGGCVDPSAGWAIVLAAAAAVVLTVGVLTLLPPLAAATLVLGWTAAQVLHRDAFDPPVQLGLVAALLVVAHLLSRRPRTGWTRPDAWVALAGVPGYAVGLVLALQDAARPTASPWTDLTVTAAGLLLVATAVRLRRRRWLAEGLGWGGTVVLLVGAAYAGAGWPALTWALLGAAHTVLAAVVSRGTTRTVRQVIGALAALAAWVALLVWLAPGARPSVDLTLAVGALVLVVLAALVVRAGLARSWVVVWGTTTAVLGLGAAGPLLTGTAPADGWQVVALVVAAAAVVVLDRRRGPDLAVGLLLVAVQLGLVAARVGAGPAVGGLVGASAAGAVGLVLARARPPVRRVAAELGVGLLLLAALQLVLVGPGRTGVPAGPVLIAAVLAGAAVQCAAAGVAWRLLGLRLAAPVVAWTGWTVLVAGGLSGAGAGWYTVALGVALLAVVALWRADLRRRGLVPHPPGLGTLEIAAIAFCALSSVVDAVTVGVLHAFVTVGIGIGAFGWGLATRVRRRLAAGAVLVLVGLVVAVGLPLVAVLPPWGGVGAWLTVAVVGLLAVGAATLLEKGRAAARTARERFGTLTAGWE